MRRNYEAELEYEWDRPPEPQLPPERRFFPTAPSVPSGPYKTGPLPCARLHLDAADLRDAFGSLNKSLASLDRMKSVTPRDQQAWDDAIWEVEKLRARVAAAMSGMIFRLRNGFYKDTDGCTRGPAGHFAQVTSQIRKLQLQGGWQRIPYVRNPGTGDFVENLRRQRDVLVFLLRQSR